MFGNIILILVSIFKSTIKLLMVLKLLWRVLTSLRRRPSPPTTMRLQEIRTLLQNTISLQLIFLYYGFKDAYYNFYSIFTLLF